MDSKISIVQLNGTNYATWKIQCKMLLIKETLWQIVNGDETAPDKSDADKYKRFIAKRDKALSVIVLAVDPSLLYLLGDPTDPVAVWKKLQDQFQKCSWANKLSLRRRLNNLRLKDGESMSDHIRSMTEIFHELAIIGAAMETEDQVVTLLASLPESYNVLVTALEANPTVPEMEVVTERLQHEETKLKLRENDLEEKAMLMRKYGQKSKVKGRGCYTCGDPGHFKRDCPDNEQEYEQPRRNKAQSQQKQRANKAAEARPRKGPDSSDNEGGFVVEHALNGSHVKNETWIIDSGATCHMCHDETVFAELTMVDEPVEITLGDGHSLEGRGRGTVVLRMQTDHGKYRNVKLYDVLFVPGLAYNLVSVTKASKGGLTTMFFGDQCEIMDKKQRCMATAKRVGSLFHLNYSMAVVDAGKEEAMTHVTNWHRRFGHLSLTSLRTLLKGNLVDDFHFGDSEELELCEPCLEGKHRRKPFKESTSRSRAPLELVHSDVCGKMESRSLSGCEYMVTFIDDYTRYTWTYPIRRKSDVFGKFIEWKAMVEKSTGQKLKKLRTDNGGEYVSNEFEGYLKEEGVRHELTVPKNPEQNGAAERANRTIMEMVRCMLADSGLPKKFWAEAMSTATYIRNRCPTRILPDVTPYQAWFDEKPSAGHLRRFGCTAFAHIPKDERKKLDSKTRKCVMLGYGATVKGYRLYDVDSQRIIHSRDVAFDEKKNGYLHTAPKPSEPVNTVSFPIGDVEEVDETREMPQIPQPGVPSGLQRSDRARQCPDFYGCPVQLNVQAKETPHEPRGVKEAMEGKECHLWKSAMRAELESLQKNQVWDLVEQPKDRKIVGSKWVFKVKTDSEGNLERYKARLVAQGCSQKYGEDYDETFSPVVRFESLRTLFALAAQNDLKLHQMDVSTAFLNGVLDEEVYMRPPEGFLEQGQEGLVCRLKKSIYGLKQSPRCWNTVLDKRLKEMGFEPLSSDQCIYRTSEGDSLYIAIYVDDIVIAGKSEDELRRVKKEISQFFDVKDMGPLNHFLGMKVIQHPDHSVYIGQHSLVDSILRKTRMENCNPVATPMDTGVKLEKADDSDVPLNQHEYQSLVGSLLYLSTVSRPDITHAVGIMARFCSKPTNVHWSALKRILRYLKGTRGCGILYQHNNKMLML